MKGSMRSPSFRNGFFCASALYPLTTLVNSIYYYAESSTTRGVVRQRLLTLSFLFIVIVPSIASSNIGAEWNPTGNPIGGGRGYNGIVTSWDYYVTNKQELLAAVSSAQPGDVIYIDDNAVINMTGESQQQIWDNITIASGRGRIEADTLSNGALIYVQNWSGDPPQIFWLRGSKARVTGLRLRGSYSELEGNMLECDSFAQPVCGQEKAIYISNADSCQIDNCELWGWGYAPYQVRNSIGTKIHHNHIHHGNHAYHGYGSAYNNSSGDSTKIIIEGNFIDYFGFSGGGIMHGGSAYCYDTYAEIRYNIIGYHVASTSIYSHADYNQQTATADIHHNTFRKSDSYTGGTALAGHGTNSSKDTINVYQNWSWDDDSVSAWDVWGNIKISIYDNAYTNSLPPGLSSRIPTAIIMADVDSGTVPLTVTFRATGSYDPNGTLEVFKWNFGDSCKVNNCRQFTDIEDSVVYTFNEIGKYYVELTVIDDDGCQGITYKTIDVTPNNGYWLSCWLKDKYHGCVSGYLRKQVLINNWMVYDKDVAGNGSWEHVVVNVTDSLTEWNMDSVTLAFRLYCSNNHSDYDLTALFIDDVELYGCNVLNGNFESGTWCGTYNRQANDGSWQAAEYSQSPSTTFRQWEYNANVKSGKRGYRLGVGGQIFAGDYSELYQQVAITGMGIPPINGGSEPCSLYSPYPNPAQKNTQLNYRLDATCKVSCAVYDVGGRFIRSFVDQTQPAGQYALVWDGKDGAGKNVANGVYFFRLLFDNYSATKQIVWVR